MKYYLYILKTLNNTLYCGIAKDVLARFEEHKKGTGAKYTRSNKPDKLVYVDIFDDKSSAAKEEYRIKKTLNKLQKEKLIEENKTKTETILKNLREEMTTFRI